MRVELCSARLWCRQDVDFVRYDPVFTPLSFKSLELHEICHVGVLRHHSNLVALQIKAMKEGIFNGERYSLDYTECLGTYYILRNTIGM